MCVCVYVCVCVCVRVCLAYELDTPCLPDDEHKVQSQKQIV